MTRQRLYEIASLEVDEFEDYLKDLLKRDFDFAVSGSDFPYGCDDSMEDSRKRQRYIIKTLVDLFVTIKSHPWEKD
jgi:hypothetical protein